MRFLATFLFIGCFALASAQAQIPVVFEPCVAASATQAQRDAATCVEDLGSTGVVIYGASANTHDQVRAFAAFGSPQAITSESIQGLGERLAQTRRYDDISIQPGGSRLTITLVEKPRLAQVSVAGNRALPDAALTEVLDLNIGQAFDRQEVLDQGRNILGLYQARGYYEATLTPSTANASSYAIANGVALTYSVDEGTPARISQIQFDGNEAIRDAALQRAISTRTGQSANDLSSDQIQDDQRAIAQAYVDQGMTRTGVSAQLVPLGANGQAASGSNPPRSVALVFTVEERGGFAVGNVVVEGAENVDPTLAEGEDFSPEQAAETAQAIAASIAEDSDRDVTVRPEFDVDEDTGEVNVTFVVEDLPPRRLSSVRFTGNEQTSDSYLATLLALPIGEMVSNADIRAGIQRLAQTGLFESVNASELPSAAGEVALVVTVEDAKTATQRIGASISSLYGFSISGGIEERNWLGYGLYAGISAEYAENTQSVMVFLEDPSFLNTSNTVRFEAKVSDSQNDSLGYTQRTIGLGASRALKLNDSLTRTDRLSVTGTQIRDLQTNASAIAQAEEGEWDVSFAAGTRLSYSTLEGSLLPTAGSAYALDIGVSVPNEQATFAKASLSGSTYRSLNDTQTLVFSLRGAYEIVRTFDDDSPLATNRLYNPALDVRGFAFGGISPRDTNDSLIGGTQSIAASMAMHYQISHSKILPIYGSLFIDAGSVFDAGEDFMIDTGTSQTQVQDTSLIRLSTGAGLTFVTGGGTITLSYAEPQFYADFDKVEMFSLDVGTNF